MISKDAIPPTFVNSLSRIERVVLVLRYAEELTPREISMVLDMPEGAIANVLSRLQKLASGALGADPNAPPPPSAVFG